MHVILTLSAAIVAAHATWSEEPAGKKELKVYTIQCKYVEIGKDGKEKALEIPTIVAEEGTLALFRTEGLVTMPGTDGKRHTMPFGCLLEVHIAGFKHDKVHLGIHWCRSEPINVKNADPQIPHVKTEAFKGEFQAELGKVLDTYRINRQDGSRWWLEIKVNEFRDREEEKSEGIGQTFAF